MNAVAKRAMTQPHEIKRCIDTMNRRFPFILHQSFEDRARSMQVPEVLTEDYLVKLSRRMIIAIRMKDRKRAQVHLVAFYYIAVVLILLNTLSFSLYLSISLIGSGIIF